MLQVPLKSARPVDLVKPLDSYIKRKHDKVRTWCAWIVRRCPCTQFRRLPQSEAKKHHAALVALQELRDKVREVSSSSEESRHLLARCVPLVRPRSEGKLTPAHCSYYAQLCYAESRFPMNETNVGDVWRSAARPPLTAQRCAQIRIAFCWTDAFRGSKATSECQLERL